MEWPEPKNLAQINPGNMSIEKHMFNFAIKRHYVGDPHCASLLCNF